MKRVLLLCVLVVVCLAGCSNADSSSPVDEEFESSRQLIFTRDGVGDEVNGVANIQIRDFQINTNKWEVETVCVALDPSRPVSVKVYIYPKEVPIGSRDYVALIEQDKEGANIGYVKKAGDFYLYFQAENVSTWTISAYE
jgi:predicted component of type VI protein secretion system